MIGLNEVMYKALCGREMNKMSSLLNNERDEPYEKLLLFVMTPEITGDKMKNKIKKSGVN